MDPHNYLNRVLLSVFLTMHHPPVHAGKLIPQVTSSSDSVQLNYAKIGCKHNYF